MKNKTRSKLEAAAKTSYWSPSSNKTSKPADADEWQETLRKIEKNKAEQAARRREQSEKNASILARMDTTTMKSTISPTESTKKTSPTLRPAATPFVAKKSLASDRPSFATPTSVLRGGPINSSPKVSKASKIAEFIPGQGMAYGSQQQQQSYTPPAVPAEYHDYNTFKESVPSVKSVNLHSLYLPEEYRKYYHIQSVMTHSQVPAGSDVIKEVPQGYNCILPLDTEENSPVMSGFVGDAYDYPTKIFKVIRQSDGIPFALRRVDKLRTTTEITQVVKKAWGRIQHVGIVPLRDVFMKSGAIFFLHEYMPGAKSVKELYLNNTAGGLLPEHFLWDVAISLTSSLFAIHATQMACRCVSSSRILVTGRGRIWIGNAGITDVLEFESRKSLAELQRADLHGMGTLLLEMTCRCSGSARPSAMKNSLQQISASGFSVQWVQFLMMILSPQPLHIQQVMQTLGTRTFQSLSNMTRHAEALDRLLSRQIENGRLLMLLLKMGLVDDRPGGQNLRRQWSGNAYMMKLFRDYVFHQVDEQGKPVMDFGHTIGALNKLDTGSREKIVLSSRDSKSLMVVSFADVQESLQRAFVGLLEAQKATPGMMM